LHVTNYTSTHLYQPVNPRILASLQGLVAVMEPLYTINKEGPGLGIGRYPEDVYNGIDTSRGNPWFLCTAAAAEVLYSVSSATLQNRSYQTDPLSNILYKRFLPTLNETSTIYSTSTQFGAVIQGMVNMADSFLSMIEKHAPRNGTLHEQFDRFVGGRKLMKGRRVCPLAPGI